MPINWRTDKLKAVCPCNGTWFSHKKEWSTNPCTTRTDRENLLRQSSQAQKASECRIPPEYTNLQTQRAGEWVPGLRGGEWRVTADGRGCEVMKMFRTIEGIIACHCECHKCHWIVHFNFMLCEFYLRKKSWVWKLGHTGKQWMMQTYPMKRSLAPGQGPISTPERCHQIIKFQSMGLNLSTTNILGRGVCPRRIFGSMPAPLLSPAVIAIWRPRGNTDPSWELFNCHNYLNH